MADLVFDCTEKVGEVAVQATVGQLMEKVVEWAKEVTKFNDYSPEKPKR